LVAIFFICLSIKRLRVQDQEERENKRNQKKKADWEAALSFMVQKGSDLWIFRH